MPSDVIEIRTVEEFEQKLSSQENHNDILICKFSPYCSISLNAERVFFKWLESLPEKVNLNVIKVDVISARPVSNHIANLFKIRHESPQIIWLSDESKIRWQGSHFQISADNLNEALNNLPVR